jgi:outer membrane lipoprotein SlyB
MKKYLVLLIGMILAGCASGPVLYPNAHLKQVGQEQAQRDIDDCRRQADAYVKSAAAKTMAKDTALGGAGGAVVGGAIGAVTGSFGKGVGVGAAGGAAAGLVTGAIKASRPSPIYKTFVNRCLTNKGYDPIGWQD